MSIAKQIIHAMGGRRAAERAILVPYTTITGWDLSGHIPYQRRAAVRDAAAHSGVKLSPEAVQYLAVTVDPKIADRLRAA